MFLCFHFSLFQGFFFGLLVCLCLPWRGGFSSLPIFHYFIKYPLLWSAAFVLLLVCLVARPRATEWIMPVLVCCFSPSAVVGLLSPGYPRIIIRGHPRFISWNIASASFFGIKTPQSFIPRLVLAFFLAFLLGLLFSFPLILLFTHIFRYEWNWGNPIPHSLSSLLFFQLSLFKLICIIIIINKLILF